MTFDVFLYLFIALIFGQGLVLALRPDLAARFQMWKFHLIGARPAQPGRGTLMFFRVAGFTSIAAALFVFLRSPLFQ